MNYFAHALPFLDNPYFAAGTAVPDWLTVCDRQARVRRKHAEALAADPDPVLAAVAGGAAQHLRDDLHFHATRAFVETTLELAASIRRRQPADWSGSAAFVAHLLVEVLLDAALAEQQPNRLHEYYQALDNVVPDRVQEAVNRMAARPAERLAWFISLFRRERILWDYLDDSRLMARLDQVMRRIGFAPLPPGFAELLPEARQLVRMRQQTLLDGIPA